MLFNLVYRFPYIWWKPKQKHPKQFTRTRGMTKKWKLCNRLCVDLSSFHSRFFRNRIVLFQNHTTYKTGKKRFSLRKHANWPYHPFVLERIYSDKAASYFTYKHGYSLFSEEVVCYAHRIPLTRSSITTSKAHHNIFRILWIADAHLVRFKCCTSLHRASYDIT